MPNLVRTFHNEMLDAVGNSSIGAQTHEQTQKIETVMFFLWAQGHREEPTEGWMLIIGNVLVSFLLAVLNLPSTLARLAPHIILSGFSGWLLALALGANVWPMAVLVFIFLLKDDLIEIIARVFFDFSDLLSLGARTRRMIDQRMRIGPSYTWEPDDISCHLFISRQLPSDSNFAKELDVFQELLDKKPWNWSKIEPLIDGWRSSFPAERDYWQKAELSDISA